ncbi:hypothetical protein ABT392_05510 [Paucibacter sp. JuS9]|uniref:hypothetical protein n=1 Tax=Paucibacter sp. JuS9 TaxID=3228748 RepID=UPI003756C865
MNTGGEMHAIDSRPRGLWLGGIAAAVSLIGVYALFTGSIALADRFWSAVMDSPAGWSAYLYSSRNTAWTIFYPVCFVISLLAGMVGAWFGPRRSFAMLALLVAVALFLLAYWIPLPVPFMLAPVLLLAWVAVWVFGLCAGVLLQWRNERLA